MIESIKWMKYDKNYQKYKVQSKVLTVWSNNSWNPKKLGDTRMDRLEFYWGLVKEIIYYLLETSFYAVLH